MNFGILVDVSPKWSNIGPELLLVANMKLFMIFQLILQLMTLDDLE